MIRVSIRTHDIVVVTILPPWWKRLLGRRPLRLTAIRDYYYGWCYLGGPLVPERVARAIERELADEQWGVVAG